MPAGPTSQLADLDDPIPISALQHAVYCLRQAALIHIERVWAENRFTAEGRVLHDVAHEPGSRKDRGVRRVSALPLACRRLNLAGVADMVEFRPGEDGEIAFPVEYKRGKPKLHRADEVQLCAQALCLEEMTGHTVPQGALFYGGDSPPRGRAVRHRVAQADRTHRAGVRRSPGRRPNAAAGLACGPLPALFADRALPPQGHGQIGACIPQPRARGRPRRPELTAGEKAP